MIELIGDALVFSFPEVHPEARLTVTFMRTLRIPDDGQDYPLPPGLERFPLRHVDDFAARLPASWLERGGVMLPMYQSEALWLDFEAAFVPGHDAEYPFAVKVAAGTVDALTGAAWSGDIHPHPQDYLVIPEQPWLDGYCVEKGFIRQFVAMPLGAGYSAEEQLTGRADGGLRIAVYPMKRDVFERRFPKRRRPERGDVFWHCACAAPMALAPGGRMRQEIYEDPFDFEDWRRDVTSRCSVHIANSLVWGAITGENPPTTPLTAAEYSEAGLPWFEYYDADAKALAGAGALKGLKTVAERGKEKGDMPLPENAPAVPRRVVRLRRGLKRHQVREEIS